MDAADLKTGPGVGSHRRRSSLGLLSSPPEYGNSAEGTGNLENETNYALIWWSGSGRHKRSCSYSSNSSSSSFSSPLWSPRGSGISSSQAGVPFSWEDRPGVPKQKPDAVDDFRQLRRLPLADPHCSARRRRAGKKKPDDDPFVTALVECMKEARVGRGGRRGAPAGYGYSCMRACSTVDSQIAIPRARISKQGGFESSKECKKQNADKSGLQEPLLYCQNTNKSCRSENGTTELGCPGKILGKQQTLWNVEVCRSVLHR